jgi:protein-S-isoprenylcysteine O-methyltransferase Ste14
MSSNFSETSASWPRQTSIRADLVPLLFDRVLPAIFFGVAAVLGLVAVVLRARQGPSEPSLEAWSVYLLGLAHLLLTCLFATLVATLFMIRRAPRGKRASPTQIAIALAGAFIMNLATFQPRVTEDWRYLALADLLLIAGLSFTIYAALCLRTCFALSPEARGLVTTGAYKLVRHPLYLGEFVSLLGMLLPVLSPFTALVYLLFGAFQLARMGMEERVLAAAFPEYAAYRAATPALFPRLRSR